MTDSTAPRATRWRDVKARAQVADPTWDAPDRQARRAQMREQMRLRLGASSPRSANSSA